MKKITLSLFFLLTMIMGSYGQVTVGEATTTSQFVPFNPWFGFSYAQSIYLASEINASGSITSIQWYYAGSGALTNSQGITLYLGQTTKTNFDSDIDYVAVADLTLVYTGGILTGSTAGWKTITLTTPFPYDGISNLIVATDENLTGWDAFDDAFRATNVGANRSIYSFSDSVNTDPANPAAGSTNRAMIQFVPNIIFGGITQACPNPSILTATLVTTTQATIGWTAAAGQTNWEVYVVAQGGAAPTSATTGDLVTGATSFLKTGLSQNTGYSAFVKAKCSPTLSSGWAGPINFRTLCDSFGDFTENFNTSTTGTNLVPNCWKNSVTSTDANAVVSLVNFGAASAPNAIYMTNWFDVNAQLFLITPSLTAIGANTHRMKFKARGANAGQILTVGTMSDPTNASTYVELQSYTLTTSYSDYSITLNTSTTANHIAFKHGGGGTFRDLYLDDMVWEPIPSAPPSCVEDINAVTNATCGNFATTFSWATVPGADGYTVSIGTAVNGGGLVVNNVNIFSALNYSFAGNPGTTYYYTVRPYNAFGPAVTCFEDSFTTFDAGCYCISLPTSIDASGVTNVQINNTNFPVTPVPYANLTENGAVEITRGVNTIMNVTLATGYSYATNVWIDFNDNFTFEPSELVFAGPEGSNVIPTVANTSFFTPVTAPLGIHRMRIVTTDAPQIPPNPCYSSSWGVAIDLLVDVLPEPACLPVTASTVTNITANEATLNWVSTGTLFNVEVLFAGEPQGVGEVTSGITGLTTTLSGLDPVANYAYYIQRNCGSGSLSAWAGPFTFTTACLPITTFPWNEGFEDITTVGANFPPCWFRQNGQFETAVAGTWNTPRTGTQYLRNAWFSTNEFMWTAGFQLTAGVSYDFSFFMQGDGATTWTVDVFQNTSQNSEGATQLGITAIPSGSGPITIQPYGLVSRTFIPATNGIYYFAVRVNEPSGGPWYIAFDDFKMELTPSCIAPLAPTATAITVSTATINWAATTPAPVNGYNFYVTSDLAITPDETTVPTGTVGAGITTANLTALVSNTVYRIFVRGVCVAGDLSSWSSAVTFSTLCDPFGNFSENFDTSTTGTGLVPNCWKNSITATTTGAVVSLVNFGAASAPNAIYMTNWFDANAQLFLITPSLTAIGANTHRMKFKARGANAGQILTVGTMSDPTNASTYVELQSYTLTTSYSDYSITLNTSTTANHIAFKHGGGGTFRDLFLDDMVWEPIPTVPPGCVEDVNTVTNATCGNFATTFSWAAVPGADGYTVSIGTAISGGGLVVDNVNIFSALNYSFAGNPGTTYYYTIRPYNAFGPAVTCFEDSFTTSSSGCYCVALPVTNDGAGVTNVQIGNTNFPVTDVLYANLTQNGTVGIIQGATTIMNITLATSFNYFTNVWIDFNDNFTFEPSELVYAHSGPAVGFTNPTTVNTSFFTPLTANLGVHRMRIITADNLVNSQNPCFSGFWAVAIDLLVDIIPVPTCVTPSSPTVTAITVSTATINWAATTPAPVNGYNFFVTNNPAITPNATTVPTGTVGAGITTANLTGLVGATVYRTFVRGACAAGDLSSWSSAGTFSTLCVSAVLPYSINFNASTSMPLCTSTLNAGTGNNFSIGTNTAAGFPTNALLYVWNGTNAANVWFFTNVVTLTAGQQYSISYDYGNDFTFYTEKLRVSYGTSATVAGMATQLADHPSINQATLQSHTALFTPSVSGDYYFGFNAYSIANQNNLYVDNIVIQIPLSNTDFDNNSFTAYPNPVKDVLNISLDQNISDVTVYNLLGQQVLLMNVNANKGQVDMANLASGTYLVKVKTENAVKTIKVIKQ